MTPREGVVRICDESAAWWRAKAEDPSLPRDVRMFAIARASGAMEVKDALPAATAREEAWKAMVEALAALGNAGYRLTQEDKTRIRAALALARSVKGTEA